MPRLVPRANSSKSVPMAKGKGSDFSSVAPGQVAAVWAKGKLPRAVLIVGPEAALREEALAGVQKAAFGAGDGGMNWVVLYGSKAEQDGELLSPASVLDEVRTRPMFGAEDEPKVVVVRRADALLATADARDIFERNLTDIPQDAVLVFELAGWGTLKPTRVVKAIAAGGGLVECESLAGRFEGPDSPLVREIQDRAKLLGLALSINAAMLIIKRCGTVLNLLEEELKKLALALNAEHGQALKVDEALVEQVCANSRGAGAFDFADAVTQRNTKLALETLGAIFAHGLVDSRKPDKAVTNEASIVISLLAALNWKLAMLQDFRTALDGGAQERDAFAMAKVPFFQQDAVRRLSRTYTAAFSRKAMEALFRANLELRTGHDRHALLEKLVWELARG